MNPLPLDEYAHEITLFEPFPTQNGDLLPDEREASLDSLLTLLKPIVNQFGRYKAETYTEKRRLLHASLNRAEPHFLKEEGIELLNRLLQTELGERKITDVGNLPAAREVNGTKISLWQGDITTLQVDAIVNAANERLLGCFQPLHGCIDNAIHTRAGVQLRDDCHTIMQKQQTPEPTGMAKITRAYNLPSHFVLHTVGPIVQGELATKHVKGLQSAYHNCLSLAAEIERIRSVAFCCISTGEFGYPPKEAAQTALNTVFGWLNENRGRLDHVVFNVFTDQDRSIYRTLFSQTQEEKEDEKPIYGV